jgi:inner membrane protein
MDNVTHTLTGLMLSRAGLNRFNRYASAILLLAANTPDVDAVSLFGGAAKYLEYHRGITHSIAAAPIMAVLPLLIVRLFARKPMAWLSGYFIALAGVASHLLLDFTNMYGIRLFLPFSSAWPRLDITSVVDAWIWTVLLLALLGPIISRLVSSEIGAKPGTGRGGAIFALVFILLYDSGRWFLHERAVAVQEGRLYNREVPRRVAAFPGFVNPFLWKGVVETDSAFVITPVNLFTEFDPAQGKILFKPEQTAAMQAARGTEVFRNLLAFSPFVFWEAIPARDSESAIHVEAADLRFGVPPEPRFVAIAIVEGTRVVRAWFQF